MFESLERKIISERKSYGLKTERLHFGGHVTWVVPAAASGLQMGSVTPSYLRRVKSCSSLLDLLSPVPSFPVWSLCHPQALEELSTLGKECPWSEIPRTTASSKLR